MPFTISPNHVGFDTIDTAAERGVSHHYYLGDGTSTRFASPFRYAWPAELDLMAQIAGMTLRDRWADWDLAVHQRERQAHLRLGATQNLTQAGRNTTNRSRVAKPSDA